MEFSPANKVVQLCLQGMEAEENGKPDVTSSLFQQAWQEATTDLEKFLAAHYVARHQLTVLDTLHWLEVSLQFALQENNDIGKSALPILYAKIAKCQEELGDQESAKKSDELAKRLNHHPTDQGPFYHGTKADLQTGDFLTAGQISNYKEELTMNHIYLTAQVNGAGLAAAFAKGTGRERVYIVEPTGSFENDPNVTDKKFPGNPTRSYRSQAPLKIVGEVTDWARQTPEVLQKYRDKFANNQGEIIN